MIAHRIRRAGLVTLVLALVAPMAMAQVGGNEPKEGKTAQDGYTVIDLMHPISGVESGRDRIRAFQVYTSSSVGTRIMLKIFRPTGLNFRLVGTSELLDVGSGYVATLPCDIAVRNGDLVGYTTLDSGYGAVDYDDSDPSLEASVAYKGDVGTVAIDNGTVLHYVRAIKVLGLPSELVDVGFLSSAYVPVVTRAAGINGTLFRTEATFWNPYDAPNEITLRLVETRKDGVLESFTATFTVEKLKTLVIHDVLLEKFQKDGFTGFLQIAAGLPITSRWRIVNETAIGPFGQDIPVVQTTDGMLYDPAPVVAVGNELHFPGLEESTNVRTNFGVVNLSAGDELEFSLQPFDKDGVALAAAKSYRLPRLSHRQWNRVLTSEFGLAEGLTDVRIVAKSLPGAEPPEGDTVTIDSTDGRLYAYASVIDNRTEDPVYVEGSRRSSF